MGSSSSGEFVGYIPIIGSSVQAQASQKKAEQTARNLQDQQNNLIKAQQEKTIQDEALKEQTASSAAARQDAIAGNPAPAFSQDVINSAPVQGPTKTLLGA